MIGIGSHGRRAEQANDYDDDKSASHNVTKMPGSESADDNRERRHPCRRDHSGQPNAGRDAGAPGSLALSQRFDLFDDSSSINAVLGEQFVRFARVRQFAHGQFVDFNALGAQFAGHRVADAPLGVMVLNRYDYVPGLLRSRFDDILAKGFNTISIN